MKKKTQESKFYDHYWSEGIRHSGKLTGYAPNFHRWIYKELSGINPEINILDVGCGDGSFTKKLALYCNSLYAVDISPKQIERNQQKYTDVHFSVHDLSEPLPFEDGFFSWVWCSEVLEHLFDPLFVLKEIYRVLKPGGIALVTVPYHGLFKNLMITLFKWDHHFDPEYPHLRFFTKNSLSRLVEKSGMKVLETNTCGMSKPIRDMLIPTNILLKARK